MLSLKVKIMMILAQALVLLGLGWYGGYKSSPEPEVKTVEVEKIVEKVVIKEVKVEVEKKKVNEKKEKVTVKAVDGTVTETEKSETISDTETKKEESNEKVVEKTEDKSTKPAVNALADNKIGGKVHGKLENFPLYNKDNIDYSILYSRRVVGSIWLESEYQFKEKEIALGLSVEF